MQALRPILVLSAVVLLAGCYTQLAVKNDDPESRNEDRADLDSREEVIILQPILVPVPVPIILPPAAPICQGPSHPRPTIGTVIDATPAPSRQPAVRDIGNNRSDAGSSNDRKRGGR